MLSSGGEGEEESCDPGLFFLEELGGLTKAAASVEVR